MKNVFYIQYRNIYKTQTFCMSTHYWIPRTQKHGYRHQNRDSSYARAQVIAKYVISMSAILNVS